MKDLRYESRQPIVRDDAEIQAASENIESAAEALIRVGLWEGDRLWAERFCLIGLGDQRLAVKRAALVALSHLVRRFATLQLDLVLPQIHMASSHPDLAGSVEDTLNDIRIYLGSSNCSTIRNIG
jgi:hypothetical protein